MFLSRSVYDAGPFHPDDVSREVSKMRNEEINADVLIVGAGPVGLFMANECARRGLRWRLIEARACGERGDGFAL
jgi:ribulose 1,5-bisphosphate synthetase/thiazole synthase